MMRGAARVLVALATIVSGVLIMVPTAAAAPGDTLVGRYYVNAGSNTECFEKRGEFLAYSHVVKVDWDIDGDTDECFGIAPNRAIYHAWRNSDGWDPMPNGGRADDVQAPFLYQGRYRTITVYVTPVDHYYCSSLIDNRWRPWAPCDPRAADVP